MLLFVGDNIPDPTACPKLLYLSRVSQPVAQRQHLLVGIVFMPQQPKPALVQQGESGVTFKVRVQPKASRNQADGFSGDKLRLGVTAPPQDGKANLAVISLLAETLGVPKSRLRIIRGHGSREKTVQVALITPDDVERALKAYRD